jgi:uncharacterized protein (TIGR03086 family)
MSEIAERYGKVADAFGARVEGVPPGGWDRPAPCEGWVARDVVGHLVGWLVPTFFGTWNLDAPTLPSAADDPAGAWRRLDRALRAALDDPEVVGEVREVGPMGPMTFEAALDAIGINDVLLHTWDLARATGQDEALDPDEVHALLVAMEPMDEALRTSGHYGPKVAVPDGADEQTRLIAFSGRQP